MDTNWKFAFGHPFDEKQDYYHGTAYFSYITKTGYGDGPAAKDFDDRPWRTLNLPHDWAVEQDFSADASHSHGYKTVGRQFPETSVGWYRKTFTIPASDVSKKISIQFDGIHRDAKIWINGFYLGNESSGYYDINYDLTPYLNYGGENVIAVRVDVTLEEGWFYEGAGIYRHVWLNKTEHLHVAYNGTFVTSEVKENKAKLTIQTQVQNDFYNEKHFDIIHEIIDVEGKIVTSTSTKLVNIASVSTKEITSTVEVKSPILWSLENPYLYTLLTKVYENSEIVDEYETNFGIRTIRFDAEEGFFLNNKHVKIKGTCNHQDHAGVGTAIPDALQEFRIKRLQSFGSNAYRCSHNPPTSELLDACDKLGMLVMVENRLLSTSPEAIDRLNRMLKRDRNHPSVIIWALGNEEWAVEGTIVGARISNELQAYGKKLDTTRPFTVASSGGWGNGVDLGLDMIGYNYIRHGDIDAHHKKFPKQLSIGSEESNTQGTRGIYFDDFENGHMAYVDRNPDGTRIEFGWNFYDERPFLSGLFIWTGFDYRGEPNPLNFPAVSSQFGILDACGFPKEPYYYLKAWWKNEPFIKITPHWNWEGKEGDTILVRVNSNSEAIELFLNNKSLGKQIMKKNGNLSWNVVYKPGTLVAKGYKNNTIFIEDKVETTKEPYAIQLITDRKEMNANGEDVSVVTVQITDNKGREVPIANNEVSFNLIGPGKIIGVGNGDPASHEIDKFIPEIEQIIINEGKISVIDSTNFQNEISPNFNDSNWPVYELKRTQMIFPKNETVAVRCQFELANFNEFTEVTLFSKSLAIDQSLYVNGQLIAQNIDRDSKEQIFKLPNNILKEGLNSYVVIGKALFKRTQWEDLNTNPGIIQVINPEPTWKRKTFNGLAQVIIQSTKESGDIILTATSSKLKNAELKIKTNSCEIRPFIE
jgi:beta-galactosidase